MNALRNISYQSISALISVASSLNQVFRQSGAPFKVLVFCRTELFERAGVYNANSIRQTYALEFEWYDNRRSIQTSHLVRLANLRASLSLGRTVSVFDEFFEQEVEISGRRRLAAIWILFHTRNTPRDFLTALTYIQRAMHPTTSRVSTEDLVNGLTNYSRDYFVNEIRDELGGYLSRVEIEHTMHILINMRSNKFETQKFILAIGALRVSPDRALEILRTLFACSAIGNLFKAGDGAVRPISRHYTHSAQFDSTATAIVHRGLWKAFNYV